MDWGYGAVCSEDGAPLADYLMSGANQEHGIVSRRDGVVAGDLAAQFPVGSRLRILPNHACATAAQFPHYAVLGTDGSVGQWPRFYGW